MTAYPPIEDLLRVAAQRRGATIPADAVTFAHSLNVQPDPWQERVLRWTGKRLLLNCSRQAGKSTVASVLALHRALSVPKSLVLLISPSLRQSGELFRKVKDALNAMPARPDISEENASTLAFGNGSRIVSLPSSEGTIRGYSAVSLIIEDEAAFVDDALNQAVRPMLAVSDGQLVLMSTPKGRRGHFFEAYERGGPSWDRVTVTGWEVPRIARAFLEAERDRPGGAELFKQEYEGAFINAASGLVYACFDEKRNCIDVEPAGTWTNILGLDFGVVDQNALTVIGFRPHDTSVYVRQSYRHPGLSDSVADEVLKLDAVYHFEAIVGDVGGLGKAFAAEMAKRRGIHVETAEKANKLGAIRILNSDLASGRVKVVASRCKDLVEEWTSLPWHENGTKEADGFPNHASDSALYTMRKAYSYLATPAAPTLTPGTPEAHRAEAERMLDERVREVSREQDGGEWQVPDADTGWAEF